MLNILLLLVVVLEENMEVGAVLEDIGLDH
jgi:hypothetical protein